MVWFATARRWIGSGPAAIRKALPVPVDDKFGALLGTARREALVYRSLDDFRPVGVAALSHRLFDAPVRPDIVHQVVVWQLAKRRAGTHKVKGRGEVSGSGKKMRPQKGSGRSRVSDKRNPVWRGGGTVHGPVPRSYDYSLPMNVRRNGLRAAVTSKLSHGKWWVIETGELQQAKSRVVASVLEQRGWRSVLILDADDSGVRGVTKSLSLASFNVPEVTAMHVRGINVYDLLRFDHCVITRPALRRLEARFSHYTTLF